MMRGLKMECQGIRWVQSRKSSKTQWVSCKRENILLEGSSGKGIGGMWGGNDTRRGWCLAQSEKECRNSTLHPLHFQGGELWTLMQSERKKAIENPDSPDRKALFEFRDFPGLISAMVIKLTRLLLERDMGGITMTHLRFFHLFNFVTLRTYMYRIWSTF